MCGAEHEGKLRAAVRRLNGLGGEGGEGGAGLAPFNLTSRFPESAGDEYGQCYVVCESSLYYSR